MEVASMRRKGLFLFAVPLLAACGGIHGTGTDSTSSPIASASPTIWAPPGQLQVGTIPESMLNFNGYGFYPPPTDAHPTITQVQAEQDALAGGSLYAATGQALRVRSSYLANEVYRNGTTVLVWVVDTSPDKPFPPGSGGGGEALPSSAPGGGASNGTPVPTQAWDQWSWVIVNAQTGAYGVYGG